MKKFLLSAVAALSMASAPAIAADIPVKAPPVPVAFSWAGCYVGANGGWIRSRDHYRLQPSGAYLTPPAVAAPPNTAGTGNNPPDNLALTTTHSGSGSGGTAGGQVGCQIQQGTVVVGLEADANWSRSRTSAIAAYPSFPNLGNPAFTDQSRTESVSNRLDGFATFRGRIGYASDRFLVYTTAGFALGHSKSETAVLFGTGVGNPVFNGASHIGSDTFTRLGLASGVGAEYAFTDRLSVKIEYLYVRFGAQREHYQSPLVAAAVAFAPGYSWQTSIGSSQEHIARVGLNLKLGGPLRAAY
jgi:outer membrane immunogenic protein